MHFVIPEDRHQITFMQSLDDLVPLDHYVRLIDALVDAIVSANPVQFAYKGQSNSGRRAYNPATMTMGIHLLMAIDATIAALALDDHIKAIEAVAVATEKFLLASA